jgi:hypothetical protein
MGESFVVALLAACAALSLSVAPLRAQARRVVPVVPPLLALAVNSLSFGTIFPGIPVSVSASDAHNAGLFQLTTAPVSPSYSGRGTGSPTSAGTSRHTDSPSILTLRSSAASAMPGGSSCASAARCCPRGPRAAVRTAPRSS